MYVSQNGQCTNENAKFCTYRSKDGNKKTKLEKCHYPAYCADETPAGYCKLPKEYECDYRGDNINKQTDITSKNDENF